MWNRPSNDELAAMPKLYETEDVFPQDKVVQMHFFLGGCDWYAVEFDGEDIFFGFACLNNDIQNAEWGYFSLRELSEVKACGWQEVDRDLHWEPKKAKKIKLIQDAMGWEIEERPTEEEIVQEKAIQEAEA